MVAQKPYHLISDEKGRFELFLGDVEYTLLPPVKGPGKKFKIEGEAEFLIP